MKRTLFIAGVCLAALLSCTREHIETNGAPATLTMIQAFCPDDPLVRTCMGEKDSEGKYPVTWESSDRIVVNGSLASSIDIKDPASSAVFSFDSMIDAPYCAVYPSSAYVNGSYNSSDKTVKVTIPATQNYVAGSFDPSAGIMIGYGTEDGSVTFKHAVAYIKMTVSGGSTSSNIRSILIWSEDHSQISGEFTAKCDDDNPIIYDNEIGNTSITLDCGTSGVPQGTPVIIALPARNYPSGIKMKITDIDGNYQEVTSWANQWGASNDNKPMNLSAGKVYPTTVPYTATALVPVSFPVYFPIGYSSDNIDMPTFKSTGIGYCNSANQTLWRGTSGNAADGIHIDQINPAKGVFISLQQEQARAKWHWINSVEHYRPSGKTYRPFLEFTGGGSGSTTLISGLGVKGIWTGDYFEFDLPVRNFEAGTKLQFTFAICNKNAPVFWKVDYLDGDTWKTTAAPDCTAPDGETTATATWAIPYNYSPKLSTTMTFTNAVDLGHLYIRLVCVDGSICASGLETVSQLSNAYCTTKCDAPFYFCEKSAERNPGKTQDAWGNGNVDQSQSISFTIVP